MSFNKILIANRGEIACRVIRTAHEMGYRTVAVYSEPDAGARHLQLADQAVCIGPASASESYLNIDAILDACRRTGADAVHPGYGFLSENANFAEACANAGITFIGPPVKAIELMGSKRLSKIAMEKAGVPCIPGYQGEDQSEAILLAEAERIGVPLMVKASAGGGGKGMRIVHDLKDVPEQIRAARNEARNAFGSDELILERAVLTPRHVEIQVFGDQHGNVIHLGERDCSIQRRHQKVVEEAPSPAVDGALRQRMGEAAVSAARACDYVGAGTVEFLLAPDGAFYFLEMNTRLQVEHPVTEMITGQDLVAWQLRVARGERLPLTQEQVIFNGHAIEVRLYAEDPANGFLPQTGQVLAWAGADQEPGLRIDHGLQPGLVVSSHYDPMLAKVIAWGPTREDARRRLIRLLEDTVLLGLTDNRAFLAEVLTHPVFAEGRATTAFLEADFLDQPSLQPRLPTSSDWALAAALLVGQDTGSGAWQSGGPPHYPLLLASGEQEQLVNIRFSDAQRWEVQVADATHSVLLQEARRRVCVDGVWQAVTSLVLDNCVWLSSERGTLTIDNITHRPTAAADGTAGGPLKAPMDGAVTEVRCVEGDPVSKGDVLVVMEAMKMEHSLRASADGTVGEVRVKVGDQVKGKQILVTVSA